MKIFDQNVFFKKELCRECISRSVTFLLDDVYNTFGALEHLHSAMGGQRIFLTRQKRIFLHIQTPTAKQDGGPFQSSGIKLHSTGGCSGHPVSVLCSWFGLVGCVGCWGALWSW